MIPSDGLEKAREYRRRYWLICELHRTYLSDVELGKRNISLENIDKIACALGMTVSELFQEVDRYASL